MDHHLVGWIVFSAVILVMMILDLGVFNKNAHAITVKEAIIWSCVWIGLALLFNLGVYLYLGERSGLEFLSGYLIEKSLSVDNIFVFVVIFKYFKVPPKYQHKTLYWGIIGAVIMRGIFIAAGIALLNMFHWIIYVFGVFLIITGIKLGLQKSEAKIEPQKNPVIKLLRRFIPIVQSFQGEKFVIRKMGKLVGTPLLIVLIVVESTDLVFALDSIPAILAISKDPFIVYSSNIFAILGLRSLYFALAGVMDYFRYLNIGLAVILCFVGVKMVISDIYHISIEASLGIIASVLFISVVASLYAEKKDIEKEEGKKKNPDI
jgi:tellurite resistance protein TerC